MDAQGSAGLQLVGRIEQAVAKEQLTLTVQLDPEHLGRVEVRLELQDGRVTAMIAAERQSLADRQTELDLRAQMLAAAKVNQLTRTLALRRVLPGDRPTKAPARPGAMTASR